MDKFKYYRDKARHKFYDTFHQEIREMIIQGVHDNILHNPRLVMYKLLGFTKDGITITKSRVKQIEASINAMKYAGLIKNHWTIDTTRTITHYNHFDDKAELLKYAARWFYLDRWKTQPYKVILMCEAAGYLGVMKNIADKYRIPYVPAKGDMSVKLKIEIANSIIEPTKILYFGDYDTKGLQIPQTIEADIRATNPDADFEMVRMFMNKSDISTYDLTPDEKDQVQMEQLPTHIAIDTAHEYIEDLIDQKAWDEVLELEEKIRKELVDI